MKKIVFILCSIVIFASCDNEAIDPESLIDPALIDPGNPDDPNDPDDPDDPDSSDLTLSVYELDTELSVSIIGIPLTSITNSDLVVTNNVITSGTNSFSIDGSPFVTENQTITRNGNGQIISDISEDNAGNITNETLITYNGAEVVSITYDFAEDDSNNLNYSFVYNGNTITRTETGTTFTTVFTLDNAGRVIQKESFDDGFSIQNEIVTYAPNGNIQSSVATGDLTQSVTYTFDNETNPLKLVYSDNYLLNFLADEYDDEIGAPIAQFHSTNNWNGAIYDGQTFSFNLTYNNVGRIETRAIVINLGEEFSSEINEDFNYEN